MVIVKGLRYEFSHIQVNVDESANIYKMAKNISGTC